MRFTQLLATPGVLEELDLRSNVGIMAFHGGHLEQMTDTIARTVAERTGSSYYAVLHPPALASAEHHLPSTAFDPAESSVLTAFLNHVSFVVTVHGFGRAGFWSSLLLGGTHRELASHLAGPLRRRLPAYQVVDDLDEIPLELRGQHPRNPVNRPTLGGVQIELPPRVRGQSPMFWDWEGPEPCPHTQHVIEALVEGIDSYGARRSMDQPVVDPAAVRR